MIDDALIWDLTAIPVVLVIGTLLHFCFDWSGRRRILAVFCPINESVWEHLKMAYWPLVAFTAVQCASDPAADSVPAARAAGFFVMCVLILGLYYVTAALAPAAGMRTRLAVDGGIFVAAVVAGLIACHLLLEPLSGIPESVGVLLLCSPAVVFTATTFTPPHTGLFEDQITGGYGIAQRRQ